MFSDLNNPIDGGMTSGGGLPGDLRAYLLSAGKWGKFVAITGLVFLGIGVVMMVFAGGAVFSMAANTSLLGGMMMIPYLIFFGLMIFIYYQLYQFSTQAIVAANGDDINAVTSAMRSMATIMKVVGVLTALYLVFMGIIVFGGIIGGATGAF